MQSSQQRYKFMFPSKFQLWRTKCEISPREKESVNSQQRLQRQKIAKAISELSFCLKARLSAKLLTWKWIFYSRAHKIHFHNEGFALSLVLKVRFFELENGLLKLMKSSFTVEVKGPVIRIKLNGN